MKKKMIVLLAGALMALSAGSAFASFGNGQLDLYAYSNVAGTPEVGVNLGSITALLANGADTTITAGASTVAALLTGATSVYAGLYGYDATGANIYVIANTGLGSFSASSAGYSNFVTANTAINTTYGNNTVLSLASKGTSSTADYFGKLDKGVNGGGTFGTLIGTGKGTDFTTNFSTDITKSIYVLNVASGFTFTDTGATAIFNTDGSIEVKGAAAAPTPIPPSFLLMGSGLLGMIGLRRKKA